MSYKQIVEETEKFLEDCGGGPKSTPEITSHLERLMEGGSIDRHAKNSIYVYLSKAANHDEASRIISGGPHGGYSLELPGASTIDDAAAESRAEAVGAETAVQRREAHLYPLVQAWLQASEYVSVDVSNLRAGGHWGNPDLVGVSHIEVLGASEIELVSVEVKLSELSWEKFIFEAISHKRFVNRSWYCYRTSVASTVLPKNMAYYAERYKIRIIQIFLSDSELDSIARNPAGSESYLDRVQERVRALYEPVPLQEKRAFLQRAGMELNLTVTRSS